MNEDFLIKSTKMDLLRVVIMGGDLNKDFSTNTAKVFLKHALSILEKVPMNKNRQEIKTKLQAKIYSLNSLEDNPTWRLRWTEDILTIHCLLN